MGKYDPLLPNEKKPSEKRKFDPLVSELEKTKKYESIRQDFGTTRRQN